MVQLKNLHEVQEGFRVSREAIEVKVVVEGGGMYS